ncbi:NADH-quinone oxidoreductase subunit M [Acrocarpospora phusangensis]|uniref:NADH-quinone oxidoreductase subunit M n=1 Tax=Acrocarpospora phusangensis TaxID=1070424 RepID=A0A919Q7G4_9ACTN|nr:NADH-quinone oxidoreductase subunit M [Acrocarpospora phusangensis]GIH22333.1 NADH-quinone oxidoreductase subunit M [Acrocarpospora phusangensis]
MTGSGWLLILLAALPLAGAAGLLAPAFAGRVPRGYGLAVSGVTLAAAVAVLAAFDYAAPERMQFETDLPWIPGLDLRFHLGVDGVSLPLVVLTALLTFLCFGYLAGRPSGPGQDASRLGELRPRALVFTLLVLEFGMIGTFIALDLLLFFVFFEVVLIPMYFVIAIWGGARRRAAAIKFILYTLLGSAVLLLGLLVIWTQTGTLDMVVLAQSHPMARSTQIIAFVAIGIGLAVKTPMWPLHTWLPDAHTEAPTVGSVLLAGVLLKMGTYGFARIAIPILPEGAEAVAPWLGAFAVVGIVYGALACLAQQDLKRMIAYSSVGHMGFVLLGFATLTPVGINAALFGNVAHGLITGLLFFIAGAIKERYGTADMTRLGGGMLGRFPYVGSLLTFACVASLGLPGLAGFWGEMLALQGAFDPAEALSRPLFLVFMTIGGLGAVLTAAYFLLMLSRVTHGLPGEPVTTPPGPPAETAEEVPDLIEPVAAETEIAHESPVLTRAGTASQDVRPAELAAWTPLVALTVLFGLWPSGLLGLTDPVVRTLLGAP